MKKTLAILLTVVLILVITACSKKEPSIISSDESEEITQSTDVKGTIKVTEPNIQREAQSDAVNLQDISNTYYKLTTEKKLTVGYFGGSITQGVAASNAEKTSWRAKTTSWFKSKYPNADISEINAACSGTGTGYGLFRMEKDLLSGNPDLIFIEFAINDGYQGYSANESLYYLESILRKIYSHNGYTDVVLVLTTDQSNKGELDEIMTAQSELAEHYGINVINLGAALKNEIAKSGKEWTDYLSDWVHPKDSGYEVYFNEVKSFMSEKLASSNKGYEVKALPSAFMKDVIDNTQTISADTINLEESAGWKLQSVSNIWDVEGAYVTSVKAGDVLKTTFSGTMLSANLEQSKIAAEEVTFIVDGKYEKTITLKWNAQQKWTKLLFTGLEDGEHTLEIRNISGGRVNIAALNTASQ